MKNSFDLRFRFKDMAGFVVLSTEAIFTYCSLPLNTKLLTSMFCNVEGVKSTCILQWNLP